MPAQPPSLSVRANAALRAQLSIDTIAPTTVGMVMNNLNVLDIKDLVQQPRVIGDVALLQAFVSMIPSSQEPDLLNVGHPPLWYQVFSKVPVLNAAQIAQAPQVLDLLVRHGADLLTVQSVPSWSRKKGLALPGPLRTALLDRMMMHPEHKELLVQYELQQLRRTFTEPMPTTAELPSPPSLARPRSRL